MKVLCVYLIFGFLRLSTTKKCPHMLRLDHRELRNSYVKLGWVGGLQASTETSRSSAGAGASTTMSIVILSKLLHTTHLASTFSSVFVP